MKLVAVIFAFALSATANVLSTPDSVHAWRWRDGPVDEAREHLELRFGSRNDAGWDDWVAIARRPAG